MPNPAITPLAATAGLVLAPSVSPRRPRSPRTPLRHPRRFARGSAVLEAALVFPILLSLTFGSIEFGYFFFVKHTMQGAAREGARAGVVPSATNGDVTSAVVNSLYAAGLQSSPTTLDTSKFTLILTPSSVTQSPGTSITVKIQCKWGAVGVRPLGLIDTNKYVIGTTVMRKEG